MNSMKMQKDMTLKDELPRWVDAEYATGEEQRNTSGQKKEAETKKNQYSVVDVTGDGSKIRCCKNNIAQEPEMLGRLTKVSWNQSTGDGRSEH